MSMKMIFWNVWRLSTYDRRARARCERVLDAVAEQKAEVVGLSEVSSYGVERLKSFAQDHGYWYIVRKTEGRERGTALLIAQSINVDEAATWVEPYSEVSAAVVTVDGRSLTIASVYNYREGVPAVLSEAQRFATKHSGGRILAGGDFNMARVLDHSKGYQGFGSISIDAIQRRLGWTEVLPGPNGTEVPTIGGDTRLKGMPRQLDRVFIGGDESLAERSRIEVVPVVDLEPVVETGVDWTRLSDHAMLRLHVD